MNGSVDFFRNWDDYKNGFGDVNGNYWLAGNDNLHILLSNGESEMRMDMEDFNGNRRYIQYSSFVVGDEASDYQATVLGPSGNAGNCLTDTGQALSSTRFSTKDRDPTNCANSYKGGWWYVSCHCTNPNGLYLSGEFDESLYAQGMVYAPWMGAYYSLKTFTMMIRRKD
ncbi:hypothetical protein FSP39_010857 [Pinctada imbricata]|uniref:Fibrinogen C-terminal domain-containing protein n=1 Tax=Pinctada imbricata TaxID=66713 RepID=A0AA88YV85_PINIB|nr:hypothetical protein FSP39_010857 [Pinctada imbricata]